MATQTDRAVPLPALSRRVSAAVALLPEAQGRALQGGGESDPEALLDARLAVRAAVRGRAVPSELAPACHAARLTMSAALDGPVADSDRVWTRRHVEGCDACRPVRLALREALIALRGWDPAVAAAPVAAPAPITAPPRRRRRVLVAAPLVAAAVAAAAAVIAGNIAGGGEPTQARPVATPAATVTPAAVAAPVETPARARAAQRRRAKRKPKATPTAAPVVRRAPVATPVATPKAESTATPTPTATRTPAPSATPEDSEPPPTVTTPGTFAPDPCAEESPDCDSG
jgi:hypothetical protein